MLSPLPSVHPDKPEWPEVWVQPETVPGKGQSESCSEDEFEHRRWTVVEWGGEESAGLARRKASMVAKLRIKLSLPQRP